MEVLDCRGLACPGPVVRAKKALEAAAPGERFALEVDSEASRENVRRFLESHGAAVEVEEAGEGVFRITATAAALPGRDRGETRAPVVFLGGDVLGSGDERLGRILMEGFVNTLAENEPAPDRLLMMNGAVKLAVEGSPVLDALRALVDRGCEIMVCGTCLDFFSLKEKLAAGSVSNMYDIQGAMLNASLVIRA